MTRKDYILIAAALNATLIEARSASRVVGEVVRAFNTGQVAGVQLAIARVADALAKDNPRFDRPRFLQAALKED